MSGWTDERVERLKAMWGEGLSASQCAFHLGGVTRNAVIGKVHRLNLPVRKGVAKEREAIKPKVWVPRKSAKPPRIVVVKLPPPPPPVQWDGPSINILDDGLSRFMCREIVAGSGVNTMFCGAPTVPGSLFSYCPFHAAKNLRQVQRKTAKPGFVPYRVAA